MDAPRPTSDDLAAEETSGAGSTDAAAAKSSAVSTSELAADVLHDGLYWMATYRMTGTEQTLHIDFQGKAQALLPIADALVARVTDLEAQVAERDAMVEWDASSARRAQAAEAQVETWRSAYETINANMIDLGEQWERKVAAAEAQVTALTQERDRAGAYVRAEQWSSAVLANKELADERNEAMARAEAAEAALAEQRQEVHRQLGRHLCYTSESSRASFWNAVDDALAKEQP